MIGIREYAHRYGGGFRAGAAAWPDDGWIDLVIVRRAPRRTVLRLLNCYRQGRHFAGEALAMATEPWFIYRRAKRVTVEPADGRGPLAAITVPGIVSGWDLALEYSSLAMKGTFSLAGLLEDARRHAEEGFPITKSLSDWIAEDTKVDDTGRHNLQRFQGFAKIFYPDGRPLRPMETLRQPELAKSLALLANEGPRVFYEGSLAKALVKGLADVGGLLTDRDFASQRAFFVEPLRTPYRDCVACNLPPNCQGLSSLQILGIFNCFDAKKLGEGTAAFYHVLTEAVKRAFADRERYVTDPDFSGTDFASLLDPDYLASMARSLPMDRGSRYVIKAVKSAVITSSMTMDVLPDLTLSVWQYPSLSTEKLSSLFKARNAPSVRLLLHLI